MTENVTISSLLHSLNVETANTQKWQSKAALQATEISGSLAKSSACVKIKSNFCQT